LVSRLRRWHDGTRMATHGRSPDSKWLPVSSFRARRSPRGLRTPVEPHAGRSGLRRKLPACGFEPAPILFGTILAGAGYPRRLSASRSGYVATKAAAPNDADPRRLPSGDSG
jgi:hypothetical protein